MTEQDALTTEQQPNDVNDSQLHTLNRTMHRIRALLRICAATLIALVADCSGYSAGDTTLALAIGAWLELVLLAWQRNELSQPD